MRKVRTLLALWLTASPIALAAGPRLRTFTSPDGVFRFRYSPLLVDRTAPPAGVCADTASPATTIVCFAYPGFQDKPTFGGAAAFVAEVDEPEQGCLAASHYWDVRAVRETQINGVAFKVFHVSDAWMSHGQESSFYRVFHNTKCYELGVQFMTVSSGAFDPAVKPLTRRDRDEVDRRLNEIILSFRFLR